MAATSSVSVPARARHHDAPTTTPPGQSADVQRRPALRIPRATSAGHVQRAGGSGTSPNARQRGRAEGSRSQPARAAQRPLGTTRITLPDPRATSAENLHDGLVERVNRWQGRERRFELRTHLWDLSVHERVRKCGKVPVAPTGQVGLRVLGHDASDRVAGLSGLASCGSVWSCPSCAAKVAAKRSEDLDHVLRWAVEQGHTVAMLTLTMRHHAGLPLRASWDAASASWGELTSGRAWAGESEREYAKRVQTWEDRLAKLPIRREKEQDATYDRRCAKRLAKLHANRPQRHQGAKERWAVLGNARVIEVTHSDRAGWHPHLHVVLVFEGEQSPECVQRFGDAIWPAWEKALARRGFETVRTGADGKDVGLDIRCSTAETEQGLASYFTKSLSIEATHGHAKQGRRGGRTPFQILRDVTTTGDADDLALWHEWEHASHGRQQLTWSKDLRAMAGLAEHEMTDEEIAEQEIGGQDLLLLPLESWRQVRREAAHLLTVTERDGITGAKAWLDHRAIPWLQPPPL